MATRYMKSAKVTDAAFEAVLLALCENRGVRHAARSAGVSEKTASRLYREIRRRLANDSALFASLDLPTSYPDEDHPCWDALYECAFACPSEQRSEARELGMRLRVHGGDRSLCRDCQYSEEWGGERLLLHTLWEQRASQKGMAREGFRDQFLVAVIYDRFREKEVFESVDESGRPIAEIGTIRRNHRLNMFEATKLVLARQ